MAKVNILRLDRSPQTKAGQDNPTDGKKKAPRVDKRVRDKSTPIVSSPTNTIS